MASKEFRIGAGSYDLNKWLYGGYECDIITTIYGPAGSGKTNFCILVAVSQALKGKKVIYIDTEGGFSIERVKQIAKGQHESALKNIFLLKPTDFEEQKQSFSQLLNHIRKENNIGVIIVDSMTMLYRIELAENKEEASEGGSRVGETPTRIKETNRELAKQLRILAKIARGEEIPIIITNQVYNTYATEHIESEVRMVGGDLLKYWSKCLIMLENTNGRRKAYLIKHRSLRESELPFQIVNEGIKKRGWI